MRDPVAAELRRQAARIEAAERRVAMMVLSGKVADKDPEKRLLRLKLGTNSRGEDVLSPWIRWQEAGAGGLTIHSEPDDAEQMIMLSMSGTIGAGSIAVPGTYDQDHAAPSKSSDTAVLQRGGRIELGPKGVRLIGDDIELVGNVRAKGGVLEHDDVPVGKDHKHTEVERGGERSGPPAA